MYGNWFTLQISAGSLDAEHLLTKCFFDLKHIDKKDDQNFFLTTFIYFDRPNFFSPKFLLGNNHIAVWVIWVLFS